MRLILIALSVCILSGCHELKQNNSLAAFGIPDDRKYMPKMDKTDTLLGIDKDKNGVRDDIDGYIDTRFKTEFERNAVRDLAREYQNSVDTMRRTKEASDRGEYFKYSPDAVFESRTAYTVILQNPDKFEMVSFKIAKTIHGLTYNTKLRRKAGRLFGACTSSMDPCIKELKH